jgi:CYTH domain-containing protein
MNRHDWAMVNYEIERKFLVEKVPILIESYPTEEISQGYLTVSDDWIEVRLRQKGDTYFLTIKQGKGIKRHEIEIELKEKQFIDLWAGTEGRRVEKKRISIPTENAIIELDIYHGKLEGLKTAEVEFSSQDEANDFIPLSWFDREITQDERYKNKNLALDGIPKKLD